MGLEYDPCNPCLSYFSRLKTVQERHSNAVKSNQKWTNSSHLQGQGQVFMSSESVWPKVYANQNWRLYTWYRWKVTGIKIEVCEQTNKTEREREREDELSSEK